MRGRRASAPVLSAKFKEQLLRNLFLCEEVYCRPSGQVLAKNSRNDFETISPVEQQQIDIAELRSKCASSTRPLCADCKALSSASSMTLLSTISLTSGKKCTVKRDKYVISACSRQWVFRRPSARKYSFTKSGCVIASDYVVSRNRFNLSFRLYTTPDSPGGSFCQPFSTSSF